MRGRRPLLACLIPLLGACNIAFSESPMFADADRAALAPRDGVWLNDDEECSFDTQRPEAEWPACAHWLVVRHSAGEIWTHDGKGQSEHASYLVAGSAPAIVQLKYTDEAKEDGKTFFLFFGLEPGPLAADGRFAAASTWEVQCGVKKGSEIEPFAGISPECRPSSQEAIRLATLASRATAEMAMRWRWLGPERDGN